MRRVGREKIPDISSFEIASLEQLVLGTRKNIQRGFSA